MNDIIIIFGPTASGKSTLAITLADQLADEGRAAAIINADAMQQYQSLPILSAQPSQTMQKKYPHLLYGSLAPDAVSDVASWLKNCTQLLDKLLAAGQTPIVVGGTGLYILALLQGLSPMPTIPSELKQQMVDAWLQDKIATCQGWWQELRTCDPAAAARINPHDSVRLMRALLVYRVSGRSLSDWQAAPRVGGLDQLYPDKKIAHHHLSPDRGELRQRIIARTEHIFADNKVIEESRAFWQQYGDKATHYPIVKTIGARVIKDYIDGKDNKADCLARVIIETHQYAKRQETWYRGQLQPIFSSHHHGTAPAHR